MECFLQILFNVVLDDEVLQTGSVPEQQHSKPPSPKVVMSPEAAAAASQDSETADDDDVTVEVLVINLYLLFSCCN